jgi:excisionase family DNA binding protein
MTAAVAEAFMLEDELLTVAEVAKQLRVTPYTVLRWIRDKRLPATRPAGRTYLIQASDVQKYLARGRTFAADEPW